MKTTDNLTEILSSARPQDLEGYVREHNEKLIQEDRPFTVFIRTRIKEQGLKQQDVFLAADIPEGYGYKLVSGEKRTGSRDVILRLLLAAGLDLESVQKALKLYGMPVLYPRIERDAALMIAVNNGIRDATDVCEFLSAHGLDPLRPLGAREL